MKTAKTTEQDLYYANIIRHAEYYTAFLRMGPRESHKVEGLASYDDALAAAAKLTADHGRFGKIAMVYAVHNGMTAFVTPELHAISQSI